MKRLIVMITLIIFSPSILSVFAQNTPAQKFSRIDSLRGSITPERQWWDLLKYQLSVTVHPQSKSIEGRNIITYRVLRKDSLLQIDLQPPLRIITATQNGLRLKIKQEGNAHFIKLIENQQAGSRQTLEVEFSGQPHQATNPPWDGGFIWSEDKEGNPFIATACQGIGASIWWPCKDHMYDEPDSGMLIQAEVPAPLVAVANGRLMKDEELPNHYHRYLWEVKNPINNYGVNLNVGVYTHFGETYHGEAGPLDVGYWVLPGSLEEAKIQFRDVPRMLNAFEYWFGPYPFYEDGYKLVQVPYIGMEHQSSVTYGNGFRNGYRGLDISGTGWGLEFDFIIIHESAHEWFANNITYRDMADMWIHESFAAYAEGLFLEYHFGKDAGDSYLRGTRSNILHDQPVIGHYGVNHSGSGDAYPKGANMLHTLRQVVDDDLLWRQLLRQLNQHFYHQTVSTAEVEAFISTFLNLDLQGFFDQYLRDTRIPVLEYRIDRDEFTYRWTNCNAAFSIPVKIKINGEEKLLTPGHHFRTLSIPGVNENRIEINPDLFIIPYNLTGKTLTH